jgi:hypothetical protein
MQNKKYDPPQPIHIAGTTKGEETSINKGKEPGRGCKPSYRSSRDSTGINAKAREPINPAMINIPPA